MFFSKDFPDKLRSAVLVSQVVSQKVKLKKNGKEFGGLCPFHNEKTPSFTVNDQKGFFHCFGCQEHGDIISFVMKLEALEYKDAVVKIAGDFGVVIDWIKEKSDPQRELNQEVEDRAVVLLAEVKNFFVNNLYLTIGVDALKYLRGRGLNQEIIKYFFLGFAPDSYESLLNFLKSKGFNEAEMLESGVVGRSERGNLFDKFRNRVIFPIFDKQNRVIAFGGRAIEDEMPKYLNSSETKLFKKGNTVYNLNYARKPIIGSNFAVVVEGYMDVISLSMAGIHNVVAGLGTALTVSHLEELFRITDKIIICLDGDSAGLKAAQRVASLGMQLVNSEKNLYFTILPNNLDPDDFVRQFGVQELRKLFEDSIPLSQIIFDFTLKEVGITDGKRVSAEQKAQIELKLNEKLIDCKDDRTKKHFSLFFKDAIFLLGRRRYEKHSYSKTNALHGKVLPRINFFSASDSIAKNIIAIISHFVELLEFRDGDFVLSQVQFLSDRFTHIKDSICGLVSDVGALGEEELRRQVLDFLKKSMNDDEFLEIQNIITRISDDGLESAKLRLRLFLLKDLLLQVEAQYKEIIGNAENISTNQTTLHNHSNALKIKEIFEYKSFLQEEILELEKQIF